MTNYDYVESRKRVDEILNNNLDIIEQDELPSDSNFTFSNAYYSWVSAIFVDIRDSTTLFSSTNKSIVSKIIRAFTSETIEILRDDDNLREIGIRGDCVYAIYTTPRKIDILDIINKAIFVNTFIEMLNKQLREKNYNQISVGIGVSTDKELVVKAGRKDVGINNKVWIGKAVTMASNFSSIANKLINNKRYAPIIISSNTYINIKPEDKELFDEQYDNNFGTFYGGSIIKTKFNEYIERML